MLRKKKRAEKKAAQEKLKMKIKTEEEQSMVKN